MSSGIDLKIDPRTGVAIATCEGVFKPEDARAGAQLLWDSMEWSGTAAIYDFRNASFEMEHDEIWEIAQFILDKQPEQPVERMAFVAPGDLDFGMARIFEAYRQEARTQFRVFRDFDEALDWASA